VDGDGDMIVNVAKGGVGLIVTDYSPVLKDGQSVPRQLGLYSDAFLPGLTRMVDAVHAAGGKIVGQIVHGGGHSDPRLTGVQPMAPSAIPATEGKLAPFPGCREMTESDINTVVEGFRLAAVRAKKVGFDGIQLHAAHGYLFSQFLSPFYNKRTDRYGGDVANRVTTVSPPTRLSKPLLSMQKWALTRSNSAAGHSGVLMSWVTSIALQPGW